MVIMDLCKGNVLRGTVARLRLFCLKILGVSVSGESYLENAATYGLEGIRTRPGRA